MTHLPTFVKIWLLSAITRSLFGAWTLDDAVEYALSNNPDIQMAHEAIAAAESKLEQAKAAFYPNVSLDSSYMRTNLPLHAFGSILNQGVFDFALDFNDPGDLDNLNVTGSVQYSLYQGGLRGALVNASKQQRDVMFEQQTIAARKIKFAVIRNWNEIIQAKAFLESQQSNANALSQSLLLAQQQFEAGKFLKTEVLNLEVQLAQANEAAVRAELCLNLASQGLLNLLGSEDETLLNEINPQQEVLYNNLDFDIIAPKERAELRAAQYQLNVAEAYFEAAKAGKSPQVNAFANYQLNKGFELDGDGSHWSAGVALKYDLYSGGKIRQKIREAKSHVNQAEQYLKKTELAIDLDQRTARTAYKNALQSMEVTSKMVEQAEESAKLYRQRFQSGVILSSELIDVENRLTEARMRRAQANTQLNIAKANLLRAFAHL